MTGFERRAIADQLTQIMTRLQTEREKSDGLKRLRLASRIELLEEPAKRMISFLTTEPETDSDDLGMGF